MILLPQEREGNMWISVDLFPDFHGEFQDGEKSSLIPCAETKEIDSLLKKQFISTSEKFPLN